MRRNIIQLLLTLLDLSIYRLILAIRYGSLARGCITFPRLIAYPIKKRRGYYALRGNCYTVRNRAPVGMYELTRC